MECNQNSPEPANPLLHLHSPQSTINISLASNHTQIVRQEVESEQEGFEQKLFQTEIMHFSSYISSSTHHLKKLHLGNAQCIYPKSSLYSLPPSSPIPPILPLSSLSVCSETKQIPDWLIFAPKGSSTAKESPNNSLSWFINNTKLTCVYNRHGENLFNKHDPTIFIANVKSILQTEMHRNFNTLLQASNNNSKDRGDAQSFTLRFVSSFEGGNLHSAWKDTRANRGSQLSKVNQDSHNTNPKSSLSYTPNVGKNEKKASKSHSRGKSKGIHQVKQTSHILQSATIGVEQNRGAIYYLLLQNDINTHGYNQWFNFVVLGTCQCPTSEPAHSHTATFVIFNISKEVKHHPNMQILTYNYTEGKWQYHTPYQYYKNKFVRYNGMNYKTIQFTYTFNIKNNASQVQFCLTYPYSYTRMTALCRQMLHTVPGGAYRIKVRTIGKSEGGNYLQVVSFIQEENKGKEGKRPCVVIIARQHPAETVSSFVCEHFIHLLSQAHASSPFDFHIIPMCNPDGTIHGNSRTNLKGYDINRSWPQPKQHLCPQSIETDHILKYIKSLPVPPTSVIDLHGHSRDFDAFGYFGDDGLWGRLINYGIDKQCSFYKYEKSSYGISYKKRPTLRGHMYYNLGIKQVATIEMSMFGHFCNDPSSKEKEFMPFGDDHFKQLAKAIHSSLIEAYFLMNSNQRKDTEHISKIMESVSQKQKSRAKYIEQIGDQGNDSDSDPEDEYLKDQERNKIGIQVIHSNQTHSEQQAGPIFGGSMAQSIQIRDTGNAHEKQNEKSQSGHGGMVFSMHSVGSAKSVEDVSNSSNLRNNSNIFQSKIPPKKVSHQRSISLKSKRKPIYTSANVQIVPYERLFQLERSQKRMSVDYNEYLTRKSLIESKAKQRQIEMKSTNTFKPNNKIMVSQPLLQYPTVRNVRLDIEKMKEMCSSLKILQDTLYGDKSSQEKCNTGGGFNFGQRTKYDSFHTEKKQGKFVGNRRRVHTEDYRKVESEEKDGLFILGMRGNRRKKVVALDFARK